MPQADSASINAGSTLLSTVGGVALLGLGGLLARSVYRALSSQSATVDDETPDTDRTASTGCRQRLGSESQSAKTTGAQVTAASGGDQTHCHFKEDLYTWCQSGAEQRHRRTYYDDPESYTQTPTQYPTAGHSGTSNYIPSSRPTFPFDDREFASLVSVLVGASDSKKQEVGVSATKPHPELEGNRFEDVTDEVEHEKQSSGRGM